MEQKRMTLPRLGRTKPHAPPNNNPKKELTTALGLQKGQTCASEKNGD